MISIQVWETYGEILQACCEAWNFFINDRQRVASVTKRDWATVNV